jgi:hypothetical protein
LSQGKVALFLERGEKLENAILYMAPSHSLTLKPHHLYRTE